MTDTKIRERMARLMGCTIAPDGAEREAFADNDANYPIYFPDFHNITERYGDTGRYFDPLASIADAVEVLEKWREKNRSQCEIVTLNDGSVIVRLHGVPNGIMGMIAVSRPQGMLPRAICDALAKATGGGE